jgi:hypothetical protein
MTEDLLALPIGRRLHTSVGFGHNFFIPPWFYVWATFRVLYLHVMNGHVW